MTGRSVRSKRKLVEHIADQVAKLVLEDSGADRTSGDVDPVAVATPEVVVWVIADHYGLGRVDGNPDRLLDRIRSLDRVVVDSAVARCGQRKKIVGRRCRC